MKPKSQCDPGFADDSRGDASNNSIQRISDLFSLLGSDPEQNIRIIVQQACEVLGSTSSLYNRLDDDNASLICWAGYNLPPGFPPRGEAKGHVCYEATFKAGNPLSSSESCSAWADGSLPIWMDRMESFLARFRLSKPMP